MGHGVGRQWLQAGLAALAPVTPAAHMLPYRGVPLRLPCWLSAAGGCGQLQHCQGTSLHSLTGLAACLCLCACSPHLFWVKVDVGARSRADGPLRQHQAGVLIKRVVLPVCTRGTCKGSTGQAAPWITCSLLLLSASCHTDEPVLADLGTSYAG